MILAKLRRARLLAGQDPDNPGYLDTHPLVREYFGEQLRSQQTDSWKECNRRLYHYYRTLAPELPTSFREMGPLFLAVICGCNAGLFRQALHEVYITRIQRGDSSFAANFLGARGALLLVLGHFFEKGRWGSPAETGVEGQNLTEEDQLFILMQTAAYLTARELGSPEARVCYDRAEPLCHSLGRPLLLHLVLIGQWRYTLFTDKMSAAMQIAERVYSLAQGQDDPLLKIWAYNALACTLYYLGNFEASRLHAVHGVQIWRSGNVQSLPEDVDTPIVSCLIHVAVSEWHLGEIASCKANMEEAISLAKELNDMNALALALNWAAVLAMYERNPAEVDRLTSDLIELSTRQNFAHWLHLANIYRGWARIASGDTAKGVPWIEHGIRDYRANGQVLGVPGLLTLKAAALYRADRTSEALEVVNEAEALAERFEQRVYSARLRHLRGVFLAATGADETEIEASFCEAIRIAKEQKSVSLQKRAEETYAEYRRQKASASGGSGFRLPL
jgi:tetratricopeptide (TPR) repeat protein